MSISLYIMAKTRRVHKRTKRRVRRRMHKKKSHSYASTNVVQYKAPRSMPFAPRYRTKMHCDIYGSLAAATAASGHYYVKLNNALLPYTGGGWPSAVPAIATLNPTGYSSIVNINLYSQYRVIASSITIEFLPSALADTIEVTVTPSAANTIPATTAVAMQQPYTKSMFMSSSKQNSRNGSSITNYIDVARFLGVRKQALQDDLSGEYIGAYNAPSTIQFYWVVNWATPNNANNTTPLDYRVKMTYYIECFGAIFAEMLET